MNINILFLYNNKKSSHSSVKYGGGDVFIAGKLVSFNLEWAPLMSVAGQRLYTIQRRRPVSASVLPGQSTESDHPPQTDSLSDEEDTHSESEQVPKHGERSSMYNCFSNNLGYDLLN